MLPFHFSRQEYLPRHHQLVSTAIHGGKHAMIAGMTVPAAVASLERNKNNNNAMVLLHSHRRMPIGNM